MRTPAYIIIAACLLAGVQATAQDAKPIQTIQCTGEAALETTADTVEFILEQNAAADTAYAAVEMASTFNARVGEALTEQELAPLHVQYSPPSIAPESNIQPASLPNVQTTAKVAFKSARYVVEENGQMHFATLCDQMRAISEAIPCALSGPRLYPADATATEYATVAKAIENAYGLAKAAADIMPGHIIAVCDVNIQSVEWNTEEDWDGDAPSLGKLQCRAKVRVTYQFTLTY